VEVKTAKRLLKINKIFFKRVFPGLFITLSILVFILPDGEFLNIPYNKLLGIAWVCMLVLVFALSFLGEPMEDIISEHKRSQFINEEDDWWKEHPRGKRAIITDKNTGEQIGKILNEQLRFLIDAFTEEHMEENDFCFIDELFDLFVKEKKPDPSLEEFIRNALKDKDEIILHWEKE
jgi:hypothetical protein